MKLFILILQLVVVILHPSCNSRNADSVYPDNMSPSTLELPAKDYIEYVTDSQSSLILTKDISDFSYTVQFLPAELMVLRELKSDTLTKKKIQLKLNELNELQYFIFSIENNKSGKELLKYGLENEIEYQARLDYFSFRMQDDIKLIDGSDTLSCELFHFERTFDLSPRLVFNVAFKNLKTNNSKVFAFNDFIFKNGAINLKFDKSTFNNIPKIKTS